MVDEEYFLYGTNNYCESLAFVLNLKKYKILKKISDYNGKHKLIICCDFKTVKKEVKNKKLKHKKDYLKLKDIYNILNKDNKINLNKTNIKSFLIREILQFYLIILDLK